MPLNDELPGAAAILVVLVLAVIIILFLSDTKKYVVSPLDGNQYVVDTSMSQPVNAAVAMSIIQMRIVGLLSYLKRSRPNDPVTEILLSNFNPDHVAEITPHNAFGYTSYTLDKGKLMRFCLRDKESLDLHDIDELTFVAFHELSHIADWDSNHGPKFWAMFKYLLQEASRGGIYQPTNYAIEPITYCGMKVAYNPYFDHNLEAYRPL